MKTPPELPALQVVIRLLPGWNLKRQGSKAGAYQRAVAPGFEELQLCAGQDGWCGCAGLFGAQPFGTQFADLWEWWFSNMWSHSLEEIQCTLLPVALHVKPWNWKKSLINGHVFLVFSICHACILFCTLWNYYLYIDKWIYNKSIYKLWIKLKVYTISLYRYRSLFLYIDIGIDNIYFLSFTCLWFFFFRTIEKTDWSL